MSSKEEKFDQYDQAYIDADDNYNDDITAAKGKPELIDRIDANYARISGMWSLAKRLKLDANNPDDKEIMALQRASKFIPTKKENYDGIEKAAQSAGLLK